MSKYWDRAWNPINGCSECSDGCVNCFAKSLIERRKKAEKNISFELHVNKYQLTRKFENGKELIMICSQSDLFHEKVSDEIIDAVLRKCKNNQEKNFLILTKRAERMYNYLSDESLIERLRNKHSDFKFDNIVFGVTVESGKYINRIELLKSCPNIKHRFVAFEPLLDSFDYMSYIQEGDIDWVIVGAESGENNRPCYPEWIQQIILGCDERKIPVFVNNVNLDGMTNSDFSELPEIFHRSDNPFEVKK